MPATTRNSKQRVGTPYDASMVSQDVSQGSQKSLPEQLGASVLTSAGFLQYADELFGKADHDKLFDLAKKAFKKAQQTCANKGDLPEPRPCWTVDRLYQVILQLSRCGAEQTAAEGKPELYKSTMQELAKRGEHMANKHYVKVDKAKDMARQLIRATLYEEDPKHPACISCKKKGIKWTLDAGDDAVEVTRTRAGGQTYKYIFATPDQRTLNHLLKKTAAVRDRVLKTGKF